MSHGGQIAMQALTETANEYFQKTSLNGFGLLFYIRRRRYQRFCWFMFIVLGVCLAAYVIFYTLSAFLGAPTLTSREAPTEYVWDTPFPGVAVCSNNKFSRRAVEAFASERAASGIHDHVDWMSGLRALAGYYDPTAVVNMAQAYWLEAALDQTPITTLLSQFATPCAELLVRCSWEGKLSMAEDCSDDFAFLLTSLGPCCVFNYHSDRMRYAPVDWSGDSGAGLTLWLNSSAADYWMTLRGHGAGFTLLLHDPLSMPEPQAGYVQQLSVAAGQHLALQLYVSTQHSAQQARNIAQQRRGCNFADETTEAKPYIHSNCLAVCDARSLLKRCGCSIFYASTANTTDAPPVCTLTQLAACGELRNNTSTFDCQAHCMPQCEYNRYHCRRQSLIDDGSLASDQSRVKLYFPTALVARTYRKNVLYSWYEILSNIGGVLGICMGCSFISGCEIVYFLALRLPINYLKLHINT